ncbi:AgmX/PglI C-terminal domain-containing protein [Enhygromyxa salina]|uniref:Gram-negative bacterial tonB protein n=1 Tax=Enhygromyxa salina TaxID=215803 RepID=A0A2S9Y0J4_9BACT|nr:AgmX/PglI C-terminal domain-containing protein [Enhygromyxa salina]PRP98623.1 hypothetical protein ENSA7_65660 [Enhygromyxa salina]
MSVRLSPMFVSLALLSAACLTIGCKRGGEAVNAPDGETSKSGAAAEQAPEQAPPEWLLLPWGTRLYASSVGEAALTLHADAQTSDRGRVVRVVGSEGDRWIVETVRARELPEIDAEPIEHLDVYRLRLYVQAGSGEALSITPLVERGQISVLLGTVAGDPPLQSGRVRATGSTIDWRVRPGTTAYWPDGSEAGEVVALHAFAEPGERVDANPQVGALSCFAIVLGPTASPGGRLCFPADAIVEGQPTSSDLIAELWGEGSDGAALGVLDGVDGLTMDRHGGGIGGITVSPPAEAALPVVELASLTTDGIERAAAKRLINARSRTVARCVATASERDAKRSGTIGFELKVGVDGKVIEQEVESDDPTLVNCVTHELRRWRFPSEAPGRISGRFSF